MRYSRLVSASSGLAVSLAGLAFGGPLDRTVVDRDANWLAHIDVEAAVRSTVGVFMSGQKHHPQDEGLDKLRQLGIDPRKDIRGITVYGSMNAEEDGVAVVTTTGAADNLKETLPTIGLDDFQVTQLEGHSMFSWSMDGTAWYAAIVPRTNPDERAVVFAVTRERLEHGLEVLAGRQPSLPQAKGDPADPPADPMSALPREGSCIFVAAHNLQDLPDFKKRAQAAKEARAVLLDIGELGHGEEKHVYADLLLTMSSSEVAVQVQQVAQGLVAMANLAIQDKPELARAKGLLSGVSISTDNMVLKVSSRHDSAEVVNILKQLEAADSDDDEEGEQDEPAPKKPGGNKGKSTGV